VSSVIRKRSAKFDEDQIELAKKLFLEAIPVPAVEKEGERIKVFISLCETDPNLSLVQELIDPFLSDLGFDVHYYRKDVSFGIPNEQMYSVMDSCEIIIALYTKESYSKEKGYSPAGNVVKEIGRERPKNKFIFYEEGVTIETMTFSEVPCLPFTRDNYAKLLLDLVHVLKNSKYYEVKVSRKATQ